MRAESAADRGSVLCGQTNEKTDILEKDNDTVTRRGKLVWCKAAKLRNSACRAFRKYRRRQR
jgi:hypothetical protein